MENITIGQIAVAVAFVAGLITGIIYLHNQVKKWASNLLKDQFAELNKKVDDLKTQLHDVDVESCKNYLVMVLADVDKGELLDEIEKERFWEEYQHYENNGGNSYIHRKVEQLKAAHKL